MNDTDVQFELEVFHDSNDRNHDNEKVVINRKRDSAGMESNDFWIGYLLIGYQSNVDFDPSPEANALFGVAPPAIHWRRNP